MKRYFVFLLCGLFLFPAVIFAKDETDTLGLPSKSLLSKKYFASTPNTVLGLTEFNAAKPKKNFFKGVRISGYARFYALYRNMDSYYNEPAQSNQGLTVPVNLTLGDGYQQPLLLFSLQANPGKVAINTELQFDHRLLTKAYTPIASDTSGRLATQYVIFKFEAETETRLGKVKLIAGGGANWYRLSPSTLWQYQYRDDLFERYPWEPEGRDFDRYNQNYSTGDIPRDQRFGMQATQGFALEAKNLPAEFEASILYGKTQTGGGFQSYVLKTPQNMFGARVAKKINDHKIGFNYFNQFGYANFTDTAGATITNAVNYKLQPKTPGGTDSVYVADNRVSQLITTVDGRFTFNKFSIFTEMGAGSYLSSQYNAGVKDNAKPGVNNISRYKRRWGETMYLEITTKKSLTYLPFKIDLYRIDRNVVNNAGAIYNTSVEQAKSNTGVPDRYNTTYYDGLVTDVGMLANNRQGGTITTFKDFFGNTLKSKLSLGMSQEIVNLAGDQRNGGRAAAVAGTGVDSAGTRDPFTNSITFEHRLNGVTNSRFAFYERFTGPYNRMHSIFRRTYENIAITDTVVNYKKSFSLLQLELKYKMRLFGKELIFNNYNNFTSVQDKFSPIPVFSDKAFLRYFYTEIMAFYSIHTKVTLVGFFGTEKVMGNKRVEVADANGNLITNANGKPVADPNGKTVNQSSYGFGPGIDYNFHSQASLHLRNRWFSHEDKNFTRDKFKGNEMTIEFKVFF